MEEKSEKIIKQKGDDTMNNEQFEAIMNKFGENDKQFEAMMNKFKEHDKQFEAIMNHLQEHDEQFEAIVNNLKQHDEQFEKVDDNFDVIKKEINEWKKELGIEIAKSARRIEEQIQDQTQINSRQHEDIRRVIEERYQESKKDRENLHQGQHALLGRIEMNDMKNTMNY